MTGRRVETEQTSRDGMTEELYQRYATRLWEMAQKRIGHRFGARVAAEDVVQSVFRRAQQGMLELEGAETLWRLLVRMTLRKVGQQVRRNQAGRRDVRLEAFSLDEDVASEMISGEPSPEDAVLFAEEVEAMFEPLDATKAETLRLSLEGCSTAEVAERLQCSRWTVRRVLDRIGFRLMERLAAGSEEN